jgi:hypothetical protein
VFANVTGGTLGATAAYRWQVSRRVVVIVFIAVVAVASGVGWATAARLRDASSYSITPCADIIFDTKFPYRTGGYRLVLGSLSVPPAYMRQVVRFRHGSWRYWRKAGLVVRGGAPAVTVTVPPVWRSRVAVTWGNRGGPVSTLGIARCNGPATVGHAYAGGFFLHARAACIPILFRVGTRSATVRFGVGRRC